LRQKRQKAIDLLDEYLRATFLDMFGDSVTNPKGWEFKTLGDVCNKITDGEHGTLKRVEKGIPLLMAKNIRDNFIDDSNISYISDSDHLKCYKRCNPEEGDILLVCVGATIGRASIVPKMKEFSILRSVALLKPNFELINSFFLYHCIKNDYIQNQFNKNKNTSAQAGLYLGVLKKIDIFLPPINIQKNFNDIVKNVYIIKSKNFDSKLAIDNLFNSLMQKAFKILRYFFKSLK